MHYYKRNIGDYAKKAGRLSMLQHGAYNLLIDVCYDREEFPTLEQAFEWSWASTEAEIEAVKFVLSRFFDLGLDGRYRADWIAADLESYREKAEQNQRIAKEREAARNASSTKRARTVGGSCTEAERNVNGSSPNQEPLTTNQEPIHSDADASGGFAPVLPVKSSLGPKDIVFALGLPLLTSAGVAEKNARSFLGMQCKAHGDQAVADALSKCAQEQPVDPVSWLQRVLGPIKAGAGKGGKHSGFASKDYREGVSEDGFLG